MQWVQSFLLRVIPAAVMFGAFDFFRAYEPTPKYSSASACLLLGFTWLWNGPLGQHQIRRGHTLLQADEATLAVEVG